MDESSKRGSTVEFSHAGSVADNTYVPPGIERDNYHRDGNLFGR
jgi:hypothetical protein